MPVRTLKCEDNRFDFVISFQVIEHMNDDVEFVNEVNRVLKPGGKFIVSTPNKKMSLTRNPWHVREYTNEELSRLMGNYFSQIEALGVYGDDKIMEYYQKNKRSVKRITRLDVFNLQHNLPAWTLRGAYDTLNRINRRMLLVSNRRLTTDIKMDNYHFAPVDDQCFDLYYICTK